MSNKTSIEQLILRMENYLECWKQFNTFMNMARTKKFSQEDENQFLEIKSVITQELELILCSIDCGPISRDDVHGLIAAAPSIRYLSEMNDNSLRTVENNWHKLFISLQSLLGQLKVKQGRDRVKGFGSWFGKKAA
jgi:REP element-mobilizing transposase RayT